MTIAAALELSLSYRSCSCLSGCLWISLYSTVGCRRINGLPKNGQAGISYKNKNYPRLEKWVKSGFTTRKQLLLWRRLLLRHCWLRNDSTSTFWNISAAFSTRHASSRTVCAPQANPRDSKSDWKIRTILAGVVKNKNDPGWDRLPPVLRHPTVHLYCCSLFWCRLETTGLFWANESVIKEHQVSVFSLSDAGDIFCARSSRALPSRQPLRPFNFHVSPNAHWVFFTFSFSQSQVKLPVDR